MKQCLWFIFTFCLPCIVQATEEDINEGHLYQEEIEAKRIKSVRLKAILESDRAKIWNNGYSDKYDRESILNDNSSIGEEHDEEY